MRADVVIGPYDERRTYGTDVGRGLGPAAKGPLVQRGLDFCEAKRLGDCSVSSHYNPSVISYP